MGAGESPFSFATRFDIRALFSYMAPSPFPPEQDAPSRSASHALTGMGLPGR